ncbi:DUF998 domain-containing protein [Natronosalvus amylolyticus]|uniref:DUF998 domain-containing protein n=1 Tax=Natronosalvus amylolyticus TaxID=2961994 RepID=UPI002113E508|nr:DUF998 domain-containing protein [Natronosalvus amylolyticus]
MRSLNHDIDPERLAIRAGLVGPSIAVGAMLLATVLAAPETFTWQTRALSDMGRTTATTFWLFNGGLIVGGLCGLPFLWYLWTTARNGLERVGIAIATLAVGGLIGVGLFFLGHTDYYLATDMHGPSALTFFVLAPIAQWVIGTGQALEGETRLSLASFWFGICQTVGWLGWLLWRAGATDPWHWFAIPETIAAIAFGGWIVLLALDARKASFGNDETDSH